ncbi:MAG: FAD-binding protein [Actinobacteria bacterium]|nr:MAG: FAD-binding protein [Actinomycetota bacterium]
MSGDDRIMVIGSGLGGLTAAVALQRRGKDVVLFEQFDKLLEVGAGITLNSNAITALREIGLDKTAEERGSVLEKFAHRSSGGKLITTWDTGSIGRNLHAPIVGISRPEIQRSLAESLGDAELRFGHKLVGLEQDGSGVTARFENGAEERGAVLIGADGGNSTVRPLFDATPRRYSGYTTWLALSNVENFAPGTHTQWYGNGSIVGSHAVGGGKSYWYASKTAPEGERDPDTKKECLDIFGDWHEPVPEMIRATDNIPRSDIYDLPRRDRWGEGRVTLLGDAAHPMAPALGQGACQAIEDGVILASYLDTDGDVDAALRAYEAKRIERTAPIAKRAGLQGKLMQGDNPAIRFARYASFKFAPEGQVLKSFQKLLTFEG